MRRVCLAAGLLLACSARLPATQIRLDGAVGHPGVVTLAKDSRLSDAGLAAQPTPDAYMAAAAWLRPSLIESQQRLKAGVLFDLARLQQAAQRQSRPDLAALAKRMHAWIATLPVTGRQVALLDPRVVEISPAQNHSVADGDRLHYPTRPDSIRVVGAVQQACQLPLVPLQDARNYLADCAMDPAADPDTIFVIEPDGRVFVQGIALWNRGATRCLAPGAIIYVPIRASAAAAVAPDMNSDLASFLATQLLPGPGSD